MRPPPRCSARATRTRAASRSSAGRGTTAATASSSRATCATTGLDVWIVLAAPADRFRGDAATMLHVADALGVPTARDLVGADVVVDALLGTGLAWRAARRDRGRRSRGSTGTARRCSRSTSRAASTRRRARFPAPRSGPTARSASTDASSARRSSPGASHAGEVVTVPIGLPHALEPAPVRAADRRLRSRARCRRAIPPGTKYDAGAVLVVGGAPGTSGAPLLAARAALRAGAGVVFAAVAPEVRDQVAIGGAELMVHGTRDPDEVLELAAPRRRGRARARPRPRRRRRRGSSTSSSRGCDAALVLDADALYALRGRLATLADAPGADGADAARGRARAAARGRARRASRRRGSSTCSAPRPRRGCSVLLKGPDTLIATPGEPLRVVETAVPGLATAGAGDVLSGVVGALLARGLEPRRRCRWLRPPTARRPPGRPRSTGRSRPPTSSGRSALLLAR